jgi:ATPase complex subunit ATP10
MLNSKVGYVYLVDDAGHIRWAGSVSAELDEKESLNAGLRKKIRERSNSTSSINTKGETPGKSRPRVITHKA